MKLQLLFAAAVVVAQSVFVASRVIPFIRGAVDDAEDVVAVSSTFFLGSIRPRPNLTAGA